MKCFFLILLLLSAKMVQAHQPDLSNLMIYEQNGKYLLVIKSSIAAFEGEIDYVFGKNAYKSPEEFQLLVIKHFEKNCKVTMNHETIQFINPKVILGHETTLFAELSNLPKNGSSIYISNTMFKDMPVNMCELIITFHKSAQKQYILNSVNNYEVQLQLENNAWTVVEEDVPHATWIVLIVVAMVLSVSTIAWITIRNKKRVSLNLMKAAT